MLTKTMIRKYLLLRDILSSWYYTFILRNSVNSAGASIKVWGRIDAINPQNLRIGKNCSINHGVYINAHNPIVIGDDVTISANSSLISTGINIERWMEGKTGHIYNDGIYIGNHVWIGAKAVILPNVRIEAEYVVIAAGAVVTNNITVSHSIWGGVPAKLIRKL